MNLPERITGLAGSTNELDPEQVEKFWKAWREFSRVLGNYHDHCSHAASAEAYRVHWESHQQQGVDGFRREKMASDMF